MSTQLAEAISFAEAVKREIYRFPMVTDMMLGESRFGVVQNDHLPKGTFLVQVGCRRFELRHEGINTICRIRRVK